MEDALFKADFYVPSAKLVLEINGKSHYYPYSTRFNNFSNFRNKLIRSNGYNILHLNSWKLEAMLREENRKGLKDWITKTINTFEGKNSSN